MSDGSIWLAVVTGGAIGALLRGLIYRGVERASPTNSAGRWSNHGPAHATLIVNVLGSLLLGALMGGRVSPFLEMSPERSEWFQVFWATGLCGALTTFGAICADIVGFMRAGQCTRSAGVLAAHLLLGISAFLLGVAATG